MVCAVKNKTLYSIYTREISSFTNTSNHDVQLVDGISILSFEPRTDDRYVFRGPGAVEKLYN